MVIRSTALILSITSLSTFADSACANLEGAWALRLDNRNLMVLTIARDPANAVPAFAGVLTLPRHFQVSRHSFSHITGGLRREPITGAGCERGALNLLMQNPDDASDKTRFSLKARDDGHADLQLADVADRAVSIPPFRLERAEGSPAVADDWIEEKIYSVTEGAGTSAEMQAIYDADQSDRASEPVDWSRVAPADQERRHATQQLLDAGALHSGEDFRWAAFVFQHGMMPDDYLLAHTLALVAVSKGDVEAVWIATATLDRYLQSIHQPQIYGTQFHLPKDKPATQEPYDRSVISDALRLELGVPDQAEQERQRSHYDAKH